MENANRKRAMGPWNSGFLPGLLVVVAAIMLGGIMVKKAVMLKTAFRAPYEQRVLVIKGDDGILQGTVDAGDRDGNGADCVPKLMRDAARDADVLAQFGDQALDMRARVALTDASFAIDAEAAVTNLTVTLQPPVTVPGGGTVTIPIPAGPRASARPSGLVTCTVAGNVCTAGVREAALSAWKDANGPAGIAVRAEHRSDRPSEVTVRFQAKAAIDGGAATGEGLFKAPPQGFVSFANNGKTLAPALGHATWECLWSL